MGTYRPRLIGRWFFFLLFGLSGVATVALVATAIAGDDDVSVPFVLYWLVAVGWNAYWWLFRVVYSLTLRDGAVEWEAPLRRGRFPTTELTAVRPMKLVPNVVVIEHRAGQSLLLMPGKGIAELAAALGKARPDLDVRVGTVGRIQQGMPGPSAWRPDD